MQSRDSEQSRQHAIERLSTLLEDEALSAATAQNVRHWLEHPEYAPYHSAIIELLANDQCDELTRLFWEQIPFGTGGRRGPMGDLGSATINARTIAESAAGLAAYVRQVRGNRPLHAIVARDSRHRSEEFARLTACVLAASGFQVHYFVEPRATPELSFAVRHLRCATGVMISASHNPPSDNGFKAYWDHGGQVLPPHDAGIIACVRNAAEIPLVDFDTALADGRILTVGPEVDAAYGDAVCALSLSSIRDVPALYTPLHGVGESSVYRVIQQLGFRDVDLFEPQRALDGDFPNVPDHLPNPERPAVFEPAIEACQASPHELILASDPDADRLAVAVRHPAGAGGQFACLTGNQLGSLLTDFVLERSQAAGRLSSDSYIIETLVTSPLIADIGRFYGVKVIRDVLVGFKHIAAEIEARGAGRFVFAAEESIGFMAGDYCRDKDASIGAMYVLELAAELRQRGQTLLDRLEDLYRRHGYCLEQSSSIMCPGATGQARIRQIMRAFRTNPPTVTGKCIWESVRDFQQRETRSLPSNHSVEPISSPVGDLLIFEGNSADCRVTVAMRPSGTEPKIKFYYFVRTSAEMTLETARSCATSSLTAVQAALAQWMEDLPTS